MKSSIPNFLVICFAVGLSILSNHSILGMESSGDIPCVAYTFKPQLDKENPHLSVAVTFNGTAAGQTVVVFPDVWAGIDYKPQIRNIHIDNATMVPCNDGKHDQLVTHDPNAEITVNYEIHQQQGNPSTVQSAIIRPDLIHAPGYGLGAFPMYGQTMECLNDPINCIFKWIVPETWQVMTSYGVGSEQTIRGSFLKLGHSLFVARETKLCWREICQKPIYFSFHGDFGLSEEELIEYARKSISKERSFFNDYDFPYYLISLIEGSNTSSQGGTCLENCTACYIPKSINKKDLYLLLSHENFHNWTGGKIKASGQGQEMAWWKEGFTDYYSRVLGLRTGDLHPSDFIDEVNQILRNYYLSPVRNVTNKRIEADFWNNKDIEKLPYQRGFVFAIYLNDLIKRRISDQHSLDNVMWDLFDEGQFSIEIFKKIVTKYISGGIDFEIEHYIENGETIDLWGINELPFKHVKVYRYNLGFSDQSFLEKKIIDLDPISKAYEAGLREGDEIIGWSVYHGDSDQQASVTVKDGSTIVFYPQSPKKILVAQLDGDDSLSERKIKQWFEGKDRINSF